MSDEETTSVEQETAEAVAPAPETDVVQENSQEARSNKKRNVAEHNWAEANRLIKERNHEVAQLREQLNAIQRQQKPPEDELAKLSPDDILTVAQAERLMQKRAEKIAEEVVKKREAATVDERLGAKYSDFQKVVSKENIDILKQQEPELAMSLWKLADDPYAQGVAAYKLIKKLGINEEDEMPEKKKALDNSKKPVSVQAVSKNSAIGNAHLFENGLTKELKQQLWKEMQDASKRM